MYIYDYFYNYSDGVKKPRWYNLRIKNITQTDIGENNFHKKEKFKNIHTTWKLSTNNACQAERKKNTDRIP